MCSLCVPNMTEALSRLRASTAGCEFLTSPLYREFCSKHTRALTFENVLLMNLCQALSNEGVIEAILQGSESALWSLLSAMRSAAAGISVLYTHPHTLTHKHTHTHTHSHTHTHRCPPARRPRP